VPFTLSHAAAVLPFRRRLIPSALVVGALAPDFEYFLRLSPADRFGHTLLGAFMFTLPVALAVLWMFQRLIKVPVVQLMPDALQRRMANHIDAFRFGPGKSFWGGSRIADRSGLVGTHYPRSASEEYTLATRGTAR